jgi:hypothetical protein
MTPNDPHEELARLVDRTLRELPMRRAPPTLEARVFSELRRRAALAWWRRSFTYWPLLARAVFLVICGALIRLAFLGGATAVAGVRSLSLARELGAMAASAAHFAASLAHTAPPTWAYEAIAVCAALYAVLFGLGAAVYRTLYLPSPGDSIA